MKVVMAGGGTAGHVFPAIAVADVLRSRHSATVSFVGAADGQEARLVPEAGYPFIPVAVAPAQTRVSLRSIRALALSAVATVRCRSLVRRADVVVGIGGYASAPAVVAARLAGRPVVLIEQNSVPGVVNRVAARWARAVATTFEQTAGRLPARARVVRTGNPIRAAVREVASNRDALAAEAFGTFDLRDDRATVLVLGGSQGAMAIDQAIAAAIDGSSLGSRGDLQLLVATGLRHEHVVAPTTLEPEGSLIVRTRPFIERMDLALALADAAVARGGAGHIAELTACAVPSILVPYPYATEDHQTANANEVRDAGAARVLPDRELSSERLAACILGLMDDPDERGRMAEAARAWARPDADERIAALVAEAAA
jgi:UDP-N-acetylglucosamine--N-acetylmuramyl-(pentapeptide) pyrophosphoryl-undecaprenol N-acetylglucosamine transferase